MSLGFRARLGDSPKEKFKKVLSSNITSGSNSGRFISNGTKERFRDFANDAIERTGTETFVNKTKDKAHDIANTLSEQKHIGSIINKTKDGIKGILQPEDDSNVAKGFFDSLFYPQTTNDVYLKTAIICLWVVALLCIISTVITMFRGILIRGEQTTGIRRFYIHLFLCEFCYLIYILLSMINVALDFQLNFFFCNIGKYGMYATVPIMYFVLIVLSFERVTNHCKKSANKIFGSVCIIQPILFSIWFISISAVALFIYIKTKVKDLIPGKRILQKFTRFGLITPAGKCSIDGQLLPAFKILFLILFVVLIILIIKSLAYTVIYSFFTPSFCEGKPKSEKKNKDHRTLIFILILLLNLFFSFPFYGVSTFNSISDAIMGDKAFPTSLKISFVLRLTSIILQCFVFLTLESSSWPLVDKLIQLLQCKKHARFTRSITHEEEKHQYTELRKIKSKPVPTSKKSKTHVSDNDGTTTDEDGSDDVFEANPPSKPLNKKQSEIKKISSADSDDSDEETTLPIKQTSVTNKNEATKKPSQSKDKTANGSLKKPTSKDSQTNGISKPTTNGKVTSQQASSATTNKKPSKPYTNGNHIKHDSSSSDTSIDAVSIASVDSDDGVKPTVVEPKVQTLNRSHSEKQDRPAMIPSKDHQRPRRTRTIAYRPIRSMPRYHTRSRTPVNRRKSPRTVHTHIEEPKHDRLSKILAISIEV